MAGLVKPGHSFQHRLTHQSGHHLDQGANVDVADRVRENRARRMAERQGLRLMRCRRRDPLALGFGLYKLTDAATDEPVLGAGPGGFAATLDEVEAFLNRPRG